MAEHYSIKERIERRAVAIGVAVLAAYGVETPVQRQSLFGNQDQHLSLVVIGGPEDGAGETTGHGGTVTKRFSLVLSLLLAPDPSEPRSIAELHNLWLTRLHGAFLTEQTLVEPDTQEPLCTQLDQAGSEMIELEARGGQAETVLELIVTYDHDREDMTKNQGITTPKAIP